MTEHDEWEIVAFKAPTRRNVDNGWLAPMGIVRQISKTNGAGAQEFAAFHLDKDELLALMVYWAEIGIEMDYWIFRFSCHGGSDSSLRRYCWSRVGRIRSLLGDEEVNEVIEEVLKTFGAKQDERHWRIFSQGSETERRELQDEIQLQMTGSAEKAKSRN